jgi:hypothetical protein
MKFQKPLVMLIIALVCILALPAAALANQKSHEELQEELGSQTNSLSNLMNRQMTHSRPDSLLATLTPDDARKHAGPDFTKTGVDRIPVAVSLIFAGVLFFGCYELIGKIITRRVKTEFIR